ncbi:Mediator of RNA polymerase II transcription subunit like [Melia azedarach]|uniref:Mediator of RNA polymerase II transcription subunit like n=1 Tax=Melia azedarach TaxID=155640 RepID=A0ACC1XX96_MELAZ|nr:Mediator of RNA polymerase II transcription subunit like [Melia azedarach]
MALKINLFSPKTLLQSPNFQYFPNRPKTLILCSSKNNNNNLGDAELASDLATEVAKINTHLVQKEEAMKKSKELLFTEFCQYLALEEDEAKKKWKKIDEEEKWGLVKGFVSEWSLNFHPLSARSVKEMLEEYLHEEKKSSSSGFVLFPGLKKIMGFSQTK